MVTVVPWSPAKVSVPRRSSSTTVRTMLRPEMPGAGRIEVGRQALAVVAHDDDEVGGLLVHLHGHYAVAALVEGVLDGVVHELGEREGQRGGRLGAELADVAAHGGGDVRPLADQAAAHQIDHGTRRGGEVHALVGGAGEQLVDDGHGHHALGGFGQRAPYLFVLAAARLDAQQRGDGLQVVLDAVMDLADGRLFDAQLELAVARLGEVLDEHQRAGLQRDGAVAQHAVGHLGVDTRRPGRAEHRRDAEGRRRAGPRPAYPSLGPRRRPAA